MIFGALKKVYRCFSKNKFQTSDQYWKDRYSSGGNSGAGSYGRLAEFKAEALNNFVASHGVQTVIEFGCGDGAQLALAKYPEYIGIDISPDAVNLCRRKFADDYTKTFTTPDEYDKAPVVADLTLSLDVLYHLIEEEVFESYMKELFGASNRYVAIYASNSDKIPDFSPHVKHRCFTDWIARKCPAWSLLEKHSNPYKYSWFNRKNTSPADLYIFVKN